MGANRRVKAEQRSNLRRVWMTLALFTTTVSRGVAFSLRRRPYGSLHASMQRSRLFSSNTNDAAPSAGAPKKDLATSKGAANDFPFDSSTATQTYTTAPILPFTQGSHKSARVNVTEDMTFNFHDRLVATLSACRATDRSSLWLYIPMAHSDLIVQGQLEQHGFAFHHCTPHSTVLVQWLRHDDRPSPIPPYATHNVGVGALVVDSQQRVLCVRELRTNYLPWKLPTGLSEPGESLADAAVREVLEETGIPTTFHSVLGFRQTHGLAHGVSDMFVVCRLETAGKEDDEEVQDPKPQAHEIAQAAWVPLDEYREMVNERHPMMRQILQVYDDQAAAMVRTSVESVVPGRGPSDLFVARRQDGEQSS